MSPFNYFTFDGKSSRDFGIYISGDGVFNAPERDMSAVSVPGRSGDLYYDNKRFKNVKLKYSAGIVKDFDTSMTDFRGFMLSRSGYCRLEDTYHPDEFREAIFLGPIDVTPSVLKAGKFDVLFNCKPQRFLKSGETPIGITEKTTIRNQTYYSAKPFLRIYGYGTLEIGNNTITVASASEAPYIDIDCETMNAYYGDSNLNSKISVNSEDFPALAPGETVITPASTISRVELIPRWWTV